MDEDENIKKDEELAEINHDTIQYKAQFETEIITKNIMTKVTNYALFNIENKNWNKEELQYCSNFLSKLIIHIPDYTDLKHDHNNETYDFPNLLTNSIRDNYMNDRINIIKDHKEDNQYKRRLQSKLDSISESKENLPFIDKLSIPIKSTIFKESSRLNLLNVKELQSSFNVSSSKISNKNTIDLEKKEKVSEYVMNFERLPSEPITFEDAEIAYYREIKLKAKRETIKVNTNLLSTKSFDRTDRITERLPENVTQDHSGNKIMITGLKYCELNDFNITVDFNNADFYNAYKGIAPSDQAFRKKFEKIQKLTGNNNHYNYLKYEKDIEISNVPIIKSNVLQELKEIEKVKKLSSLDLVKLSIDKINNKESFKRRKAIFNNNNKEPSDNTNANNNSRILGSIFTNIMPSGGVKYIENNKFKENRDIGQKIFGRLSVNEYNNLKILKDYSTIKSKNEFNDEHSISKVDLLNEEILFFNENQEIYKQNVIKIKPGFEIFKKINFEEKSKNESNQNIKNNLIFNRKIRNFNNEKDKIRMNNKSQLNKITDHSKLIKKIINDSNWGYGNIEGSLITKPKDNKLIPIIISKKH